MHPSNRLKPIDWRAWVTLIWAIWFGAQYVEMVATARRQQAVAIVRSMLGIGR